MARHGRQQILGQFICRQSRKICPVYCICHSAVARKYYDAIHKIMDWSLHVDTNHKTINYLISDNNIGEWDEFKRVLVKFRETETNAPGENGSEETEIYQEYISELALD